MKRIIALLSVIALGLFFKFVKSSRKFCALFFKKSQFVLGIGYSLF